MNLQRIKIVNICDKIILFSLYGIAYFLPISKAIIESLSILAIICFVVKKFFARQGISKTDINFALFTYLTICFVSIFISSNLKISARTFFCKTLQNTIFFFAVVDTLNTKTRFRTFIYVMLVSLLLLGIDGIYQHFTRKDFIRNRPYYDLPRIHATFPTPNDFGCYLVSLIPFTLIVIFDKFHPKLLRLLSISLLILLLTCLIFTVSRGAWLAFVSMVLFMSIWIKPLGIFFLLLWMFIIITQQFYYPLLKERLSNFFIFADSSSRDRIIIWDAACRMFMHRPWLGLGLGTFMFNFSKFVGRDYPHGVPYAHNCYLQIGSEIGAIGLLSFLSLIILFFYHGIKNLHSKERTFSWYILLASLAGMLGYCLQMLVDTIFYSLDLGMLFWILLGLGTAAMNTIELGNNKATIRGNLPCLS